MCCQLLSNFYLSFLEIDAINHVVYLIGIFLLIYVRTLLQMCDDKEN